MAPQDPAAKLNRPGPIARVASAIDRARVLFIPLAMAALLAVGAHAAADALGDLFLEWIDRAQGAFDSLAARWSVTAPLVDLIGLTRRTQMARLSALGFELAADLLLALPMLVFEEKPDLLARSKAAIHHAARRPALITIARTIFAAALGLAGAASVARLVHGIVALQLKPIFGTNALGVPRVIGLVFLLWLTAVMASRSALWTLERTDLKSQRALNLRARFLFGLTGSLILAPLALAAVLRAMPLDSFLR